MASCHENPPAAPSALQIWLARSLGSRSGHALVQSVQLRRGEVLDDDPPLLATPRHDPDLGPEGSLEILLGSGHVGVEPLLLLLRGRSLLRVTPRPGFG